MKGLAMAGMGAISGWWLAKAFLNGDIESEF